MPGVRALLVVLLCGSCAFTASCGGEVDMDVPGSGDASNTLDAGLDAACDGDAACARDAAADVVSEDSPDDRADGMSYGDGYQP